MESVTNSIGQEEVRETARRSRFYMLRWETEFTPCTGITAVTRQERRHFGRRGVMIAPWQAEMAPARQAIERGQVVPTDFSFQLTGPCAQGTRIRVLASSPGEAAPILFLAATGAFQGKADPYDSPDLARDTLLFGAAVAEFLTLIGASPRQFAWGTDWQTVPALIRLRRRNHTVLTLHNEFDAWLAREATDFGGGLYPEFRGQETALRIGLKLADVVTTVNRGYAWGLRNEPIHTKVMADHLQDLIWRIVPVENGNFTHPGHDLLELARLLERDWQTGLRARDDARRRARAGLPAALGTKIGERVLVVSMGRRVGQKLYDVTIAGIRELLRRRPDAPLFVVFATVPGDAADRFRLERMRILAAEFPGNVAFLDGRLEYFATLMAAADYNAMTSLYEPHGGAFEGAVVPVVRLIDGLAAQVNAYEPRGRAAWFNAIWHEDWEPVSGLGFREQTTFTEVNDLRALLGPDLPSPGNRTFRAMVSAFAEVLETAVTIRAARPDVYARLVRGALKAQEGRDWLVQLGGILALVEEARLRRPLAEPGTR